MYSQEHIFGRLPVARKLLVIVSVFVAIVVCVFYLGVLRSEILSGIRAYVGGEGLWSKAEKRAVFSLTKYAESHSESDYQQYLTEIAVPLGDTQARLQLERPTPDMLVVNQGFVQGRNSPDDVADMARLFRRFRHVGYMAQAIEIWTDGDGYIDQLRDLAGELHAEVTSSRVVPAKVQQIKDRIAIVDARVTPLEDDFSSTLGQGARWINRLLSIVTIAASALLLLLGVGLSLAVLKQIRNSEEKYRNLIDTANDAILVIDAENRLVLGSQQQGWRIAGLSRAKAGRYAGV
jgi:PAS domain-containing protein